MENIKIFYDSQHLFYKNPFGAVPCGSKIFFRIGVEECDEINLELINFNGLQETVNMKKANESIDNINEKAYVIDVSMRSTSTSHHNIDKVYYSSYFVNEIEVKEPGILEYYFSIKKENQWFYYGNNEVALGGVGKLYNSNPKPYQITVYEDFKVPNWYKEGIIYQIFVDSFYKGNGSFSIDSKNNISQYDNKNIDQNMRDNKDYNFDNNSDKQVIQNRENNQNKNNENSIRIKSVNCSSSAISSGKKNSFIYGEWYDEPMYIKDPSGNILRWAFYGGNLQGVIEKLSYLKNLGVTILYLNPIFEATSVHKYDTGDYMKIDPMFGDEEKFKDLCKKAKDQGIRIILDGVFSHTGDDSVYFNKFGNYEGIGAYQSQESLYFKWYQFTRYPNDYDCWWGVKSLPNVKELEPSYMDFIINSENSVINKWLKLGAMGWRLDVADELPDAFIEALKKKVKELKEDGVVIGEVWEDASNKVSYGQRRRYLLGKELDSIMNYPFRNMTLDFFRGYINSQDFIKRSMSLYENYPKEVFYANMNLLGTHDTERLLTMFLDYSNDENTAKALLKLATLLQITFPGVPCIYYGDEAGLTGGKDPYNRKAYPWNREDGEILSWYKTITSIRNQHEVFKYGDLVFYKISEEVLCFKRTYGGHCAIVIINRSIKEVATIKLDFNGKELTFQNLMEREECLEAENGVLKINLRPLKSAVLVDLQ
ncbi:glycoside hydrolase family 13 protein [Clostridium sp.]|uniref:glycoside hydrolase family 13 protein n=1 Tax=Clostridium sp. TaxID=1506 RepID=UPI002FCA86D0